VTGEETGIDAAAAQAMLDHALADPRQGFNSSFLSRLLGLRVSYEGERCSQDHDKRPVPCRAED
jgi:hypothetical protein